MTLPPLEELKRLQAEATPGEWEAYDPGDGTARLYAGTAQLIKTIEHDGEIVGAYLERPDGEVIALAPELLATAIKVHEAIDFLKKRWDTLNQDSSRVSGGHAEGFMEGIDYAIGTITRITRITRIMEGVTNHTEKEQK